MIQISELIDRKPVYKCSFCKKEIDHKRAIDEQWLYCHHCGRELWNTYSNPWR